VQKERGFIYDIRGYGTFLGFDVANAGVADKLT
jgi:hypothetical protein